MCDKSKHSILTVDLSTARDHATNILSIIKANKVKRLNEALKNWEEEHNKKERRRFGVRWLGKKPNIVTVIPERDHVKEAFQEVSDLVKQMFEEQKDRDGFFSWDGAAEKHWYRETHQYDFCNFVLGLNVDEIVGGVLHLNEEQCGYLDITS